MGRGEQIFRGVTRWGLIGFGIGWVVAAFFVAVFPGNVSQYLTGTAAFGLETDTARFVRLLFQPVLVAAALWSTGEWAAWRSRRSTPSPD